MTNDQNEGTYYDIMLILKSEMVKIIIENFIIYLALYFRMKIFASDKSPVKL